MSFEQAIMLSGTLATWTGIGIQVWMILKKIQCLSLFFQWLCRLITPPNGIVLDCFAGSGSTLVACVQEGFHFIGIEQSAEYAAIARARIAHALREVQG